MKQTAKAYESNNQSLHIVILVVVGLCVVTAMIAIAILVHKNQKLEACDRISDNAARIICISDQ